MAEPNPFTGFEPRETRRQPRALWTICLIQFGQNVTYAALFFTLSEPDASGVLEGRDVSTFVTAMVFANLATVPGGWVADRFLGARRAVLAGCIGMILAALGSAIPSDWTRIVGLAGLVIGNGFLTPNVSVVLGRAYDGHDARRYAGFALLQAGSLLGAAVGHAFGGVGTAFIGGLIAVTGYAIGRGDLGAVGIEGSTASVPRPGRPFRVVAAWGGAILFVSLALGLTAIVSLRFEDRWLSDADSVLSLALVLGFFVWAALSRRWTHLEAGRIQAIAALAVAAAVLSTLSSLSEQRASAFAASDWWGLTLASLDRFTGWLSAAAAVLVAWAWQRRSNRPIPGPRVYAYGLLLAAGVLAAGSFSAEQLFVRPIVIGVLLSILNSAVVAPVGTALVVRIAPASLTGTTVAIWDLVGFGASSLLALAGDPEDLGVPIIAAVVGLCLIVAVVLFTQSRRLESMIEGPSSPPRPSGSPFLRPAMYAAVTLVAVVMVWTVVQAAENRNAGTVVVSATPTFLPAAANLPAGDMLGFVAIAQGAYPIGAPDDDRLAARDERPVHTVALASFLIGRYEVTVAQYQQCVSEGGCIASDPRALDGPDDWPVRYVNWNEAMAYCAWLEKKLASLELPKPLSEVLSRLNTRSVSLPSEAEWEAAGQSLGFGPYPWAGALTPSMANYAASGRLTPVPVGTFARALGIRGLMDASGNVAEWTRSTYRDYPFAPDSQGSRDPRSERVIRGGSFYDDVTLLRTSSRQVADAATGYDFVGFRVVVGVVVSQTTGAAGQ